MKAITAGGEAGAARVVQVMRAHPMERDEIMEWLQQHRGNAFVQQVTAKMGQVERALPEGVELKSVRGSITIPGGKKLTGNWQASIATKHATTLTVEVSGTGVNAWLSPSLHVDATWPLQNAEIRGAGVRFADGKPYANVTDGRGLGSGMISVSDNIEEKITSAIAQGIAGSPLARPGYVPTQDPNLGATLDAVMANMGGLFEGGGNEGNKKKKDGITPDDMDRVSAGGTISLRAGGQFLKDGTGLAIAPGSDLSVSVEGGGDLQDVMDAGTNPEAALKAASIQAIRINAGDMQVKSKGKPIAKITALTVRPGGRVTIDHMELLGSAATARAGEAGLSLLVGLLALGARDARTAGGAFQNAQDPQLVDGISRQMMEEQFTETVQKMVLQYRAAVPGLDLATVLGIG